MCGHCAGKLKLAESKITCLWVSGVAGLLWNLICRAFDYECYLEIVRFTVNSKDLKLTLYRTQLVCGHLFVVLVFSTRGELRTTESGNEPLFPTKTLVLQGNFRTMMDDMNCDPRIAEVWNTKLEPYLNDHPFFTLVLLVFVVIASVPVGLFLAFAVGTFVAVTVFFVFVEIFLLTAGVATLLCVLFCLAVIAFSVSCILSALYISTSHVLNYFFLLSVSEQRVSTIDMETKKNNKPVW